MASESRQLPQSNITRMSALDIAKAKNDALGAGSFITAATQSRLNTIHTSYRNRYDGVYPAKQTMVSLTNQKDGYAVVSRMTNSHFIQVFNLAVERNVFPIAHRVFYKLDEASGNVPEMISDAQIIQIGKDIIKGEADRTAPPPGPGGAPMLMPSIINVTAAHNNLNGILMPHSTGVDGYDQALETLDALNEEADAVIKKVWDEVETFYNEEEPSSQRQNAREWGVIYILQGSSKTVTGIVTDFDTNLPVEGAEIFFENGNKKALSAADGSYSLSTTLMNQQNLLAQHALYNNYLQQVTLIENENLVWNFKMQKVV